MRRTQGGSGFRMQKHAPIGTLKAGSARLMRRDENENETKNETDINTEKETKEPNKRMRRIRR